MSRTCGLLFLTKCWCRGPAAYSMRQNLCDTSSLLNEMHDSLYIHTFCGRKKTRHVDPARCRLYSILCRCCRSSRNRTWGYLRLKKTSMHATVRGVPMFSEAFWLKELYSSPKNSLGDKKSTCKPDEQFDGLYRHTIQHKWYSQWRWVLGSFSVEKYSNSQW